MTSNGPPENLSRKFAIHFGENEVTVSSYSDNAIRTSHYSVYPWHFDFFLYKNLYQQFLRKANVYFLCIAVMQSVPGLSPTGRFTTLTTLVAVMSFSAAKSAYEDYARHTNDAEVNTRKVTVNGVEKQYRDIRVNDTVTATHDLPCDLLLIKVSDDGDGCYVETSNLDGETNLKPKTCVAHIPSNVEYEGPNRNLYTFNGAMDDGSVSILPENILLRGTTLRKAKWAMGIALYTGVDTKVFQNSTKAPGKSSRIEKNLNKYLAAVLATQIVLVVIATLGYSLAGVESWYLPGPAQPPYLAFITFIILFNNLIPISLYVSLEMIRFAQGRFLAQDKCMFYEQKSLPLVARTTNVNEDLGQITHIFSDKTGTLTKNVMKFRKFCLADGTVYGQGVTEIGRAAAARRGVKDITDIRPKEVLARHANSPVQCYDPLLFADTEEETQWAAPSTEHGVGITNLFTMLSVCHTVVCEDDGHYEAESPDELALVEAAKFFGFNFRGRNAPNTTNTILHVFEFNSDRRRMSVVIRDTVSGAITLFTKGADSVMLPRCTNVPSAKINAVLSLFGEEGLRTLVCCSRAVSPQAFGAWSAEYAVCRVRLDVLGMQTLHATLEDAAPYDLLGVTAIEDKLQDNVPSTITALRAAGISVWMLTGDKRETAVNIAYACNLLADSMKWTVLESLDDLEKAKGANFDGVVMDGDFIAMVTKKDDHEQLYNLLTTCSGVVCCRVSPRQKSDVVELVRNGNPLNVTLAIGDGANDVPMIQAAHVGVGISGMEGQQASNSADFAFGQFMYLRRLVLVHGHMSYFRQSTTITYFFYKTALVVFSQFFFCVWNGWSGMSLYEPWELAMYNVMFTALPILAVGIFDRPILNTDHYATYPLLYHESQSNSMFTLAKFGRGFITSLVHAALLTFLTIGTTNDSSGLDEAGTALYTAVIVVATATLCVRYVWSWAWPTTFSVVASITAWVVFLPVYGELGLSSSSASYRVAGHLVKTPLWAMYGVILITLSQTVDVLIRSGQPLSNHVRSLDAADPEASTRRPAELSEDPVVQKHNSTALATMHWFSLKFDSWSVEDLFYSAYVGDLARFKWAGISSSIGATIIVIWSYLQRVEKLELGMWICFAVTCYVFTFVVVTIRASTVKDFLHILMIFFTFYIFSAATIATTSRQDDETHPLTYGVIVFGLMVMCNPLFTYAINYMFIAFFCFAVWLQIFKSQWSAVAITARIDEVFVIALLGLMMLRDNETTFRVAFLATRQLEMDTRTLQEEEKHSLELLCNVMPLPLVKEIKDNHRGFEEFSLHYPESSVLVSDIVGFTKKTAAMDTGKVVTMLNQMFTKFDHKCNLLKCEKIKTIGDAYVCAAGVPISDKRHMERVADMALSMLVCLADMKESEVTCRIGIATGPLFTGIIGFHKICYELFGRAVLEAEEMERTGVESKIQCSAAMVETLTRASFRIQSEGGRHFVLGRSRASRLSLLSSGLDDTDEGIPFVSAAGEAAADHTKASPLSPPGMKLQQNLGFRKRSLPEDQKWLALSPTLSASKEKILMDGLDGLEENISLDFNRWTLRFASQVEEHYYATMQRKMMEQQKVLAAWMGLFLSIFTPLFVILSYPSIIDLSAPLIYVMAASALIHIGMLVRPSWVVSPGAGGVSPSWAVSVSLQCASLLVYCVTCYHGRAAGTVGAFQFLPLLLYFSSGAQLTYLTKIAIGVTAMYVPFAWGWLVVVRIRTNTFTQSKDPAVLLACTIGLWLCNYGCRTSERSARLAFIEDTRAGWKKIATKRTLTRSEELLLHVLPRSVLARMKANEKIVDRAENATVMFIYFPINTSSDGIRASQAIVEMNSFLAELDRLTELHGCEKIKTSPYLVVAGCPEFMADHAVVMARLGLAVIKRKPTVRVGIHSGPVSAGVLGTSKFLYDVFGDTVNVASRLASSADQGSVHISCEAAALLVGYETEIRVERRGEIELKGRGVVTTHTIYSAAPKKLEPVSEGLWEIVSIV